MMRTATWSALAQFICLTISFGLLVYSFAVSDFSVRLIAEHSHSAKPLLYKLSGTWGNHEGSLLLWALILSLFGALFAFFSKMASLPLKTLSLSMQGLVSVGFLLFLIFTSNPFERLFPVPPDGQDLNPLLQDPGLAFHPPFLYLGYVGLSMTFSFAIAGLIAGKVDADWARALRPWTLVAWSTLTVGIALGSYWAYYELGWGGWWFWDPVENASLMPWLVATALLHCVIVVEKREALKSWTILLAILAFGFSLLGTFIVRSGIITSVHAFANDPERGVFILLILLVFLGLGFGLYVWRSNLLTPKGYFLPISREGALIYNNLILSISALVVLVGTLYPLFLDILTGAKISVGPPFFNISIGWLMVLLLLALPIGAMLPWKKGDISPVLKRLRIAIVLSLAVMLVIWVTQTNSHAWFAPIGLGLAVWAILGIIADISLRIRLGSVPLTNSLGRLLKLPRAEWAKLVAHFGIAVTAIGITAVSAWQVEDIRVVPPQSSFTLSGYTLKFDGVERQHGVNYRTDKGTVEVFKAGQPLATLYPEKRFYPVQNTTTTEAAIMSGFFGDVYIVLGEPRQNGHWVLRTYIKPFANWIWGGALLMAVGGIISIFRKSSGYVKHVTHVILLALCLAQVPLMAHAQLNQTDPVELNQSEEKRANNLYKELRCLVCRNQSIAESDAQLAVDLRTLVSEKISQGKTDDDIRTFLVARYGDYILLNPPMQKNTLILWLIAPISLLIGVFVASRVFQQKHTQIH
jgi:cytochrome c-type biogenesis protein CcmF